MSRILLCLLLALALPGARAAPKVVASILPVHSLAAAVMQGQDEPWLLVPGGQSPHHFSLRPSDAQALQQADLVVWVGPELEGFLRSPLLGVRAKVLTLLDVDEVGVLSAGTTANQDHTHENAEPGRRDAHLWLDPRNAITIANTLATALSELDPPHREQYQGNAEQLTQRLRQLDLELEQRLALVKDHPYVVFHDAYRYLEQRYGLRPVGVVAVDPERPPGARRVREVRAAIRSSGARCVFSEPQFPSRLVPVLLEDSGARSAVLDPLGTGIPPGPDAYFQLMRQLASALLDCLHKPEVDG